MAFEDEFIDDEEPELEDWDDEETDFEELL